MPNLKQILTIKSRFGSDTQISKADEINDLFEGFDISKGFEEPRLQTKSFSYTSNIASSYFDYFKNRSRVNVVLLFIDITSFSGKFNSKKPSELGIYLDRYYSVYSGETDHPIPWQTDHLKGWRTVVSNAIEL